METGPKVPPAYLCYVALPVTTTVTVATNSNGSPSVATFFGTTPSWVRSSRGSSRFRPLSDQNWIKGILGKGYLVGFQRYRRSMFVSGLFLSMTTCLTYEYFTCRPASSSSMHAPNFLLVFAAWVSPLLRRGTRRGHHRSGCMAFFPTRDTFSSA